MDENVRTVISPDKAVAPGIYEPLHLALHLHTYCSQRYARAASKASADWHFPNNSFLSCSFFACSRGCMRVLKNERASYAQVSAAVGLSSHTGNLLRNALRKTVAQQLALNISYFKTPSSPGVRYPWSSQTLWPPRAKASVRTWRNTPPLDSRRCAPDRAWFLLFRAGQSAPGCRREHL